MIHLNVIENILSNISLCTSYFVYCCAALTDSYIIIDNMARYPEMNWKYPDLAEELKLFRQRMKLCLDDNDVNDPKKRAVKIKIAIGNEGLRRINSSGLSEPEQENPVKLWEVLQDQLEVKMNFRIHRLEFMRHRQKAGESIDEFVSRCPDKAKLCQFDEKELAERIVELVISSTPIEAFQKYLLDQPQGYSIASLLNEGRKYEAIVAGRQCLETLGSNGVTNINAISHHPVSKCKNCGLRHEPRKCPAYRSRCNGCGERGHWKKFCTTARSKTPSDAARKDNHGKGRGRSKSRTQGGRDRGRSQSRKGRRNFHPLQFQDEGQRLKEDQTPVDDFESLYLETISVSEDLRIDSIPERGNQDEVFADIAVSLKNKPGEHTLKVKVDTGAQGNILPTRILRKTHPELIGKDGKPDRSKIEQKHVRLLAYNDSAIPQYGIVKIPCRHEGE